MSIKVAAPAAENCTFMTVALFTDPSRFVNDTPVAIEAKTSILIESLIDIAGVEVSCTYFLAVRSITK